jgi:hypothetical protein
MPVNAIARSARIGPIASSARACGSRSPAIIALIMAVQDWLPASFDATEVSLHRASSSSFSGCLSAFGAELTSRSQVSLLV